MFNKNKFKSKVIEKGFSIAKIAELLGINQATLHRKVKGQSEFTRSEIQMLRLALNLDTKTIEDIFFAD